MGTLETCPTTWETEATTPPRARGLRVRASPPPRCVPTPGTSNPSGRQPVESSYIRWACLQHPGRGIFRPGFSGPADTPDGSQHRGDLRPPFMWTVAASPRLPARERPLTPAGTTVRSVGRQSRSGAQSLRRRGQAAGPLRETRPPTTMPSVGREWGQRALCMPTVVPSRSSWHNLS
jgi:hypothetical protein